MEESTPQQRERHQTGSIYEASGKFYVRYRATKIIDGVPKRVQQSEPLCDKDVKHYSADCKALKMLRDRFMLKINARQTGDQSTTVTAFWDGIYLPFAKKNLRGSTLHGYEQIWSQHLKSHFGETKLPDYTTGMASRFLTKLEEKYSRRTLNHIRSAASAISYPRAQPRVCSR